MQADSSALFSGGVKYFCLFRFAESLVCKVELNGDGGLALWRQFVLYVDRVLVRDPLNLSPAVSQVEIRIGGWDHLCHQFTCSMHPCR